MALSASSVSICWISSSMGSRQAAYPPCADYRDNHVRYSGGIECGTAVYRVEWSDTGLILSQHTVAYRCIPL